MVSVAFRPPGYIHGIAGLSEVDFAVEAHLFVDKLGDPPEAAELVELVLEHLVVQLQFIYVFVEGEHVVVRPN